MARLVDQIEEIIMRVAKERGVIIGIVAANHMAVDITKMLEKPVRYPVPLELSSLPVGFSPELAALIEKARDWEANATPEEKEAMHEAQRKSWIRGMTTPCEHGVLDFESCPECRA